MASELMRIMTKDGEEIFVEVDDEAAGFQPVSRHGTIIEARERFEKGLQDVSAAAQKALGVFRDGTLRPDEIEIEFGVRFNWEAGAVFAKTAAEGHLTVKLNWSREGSPGQASTA
ncbi:CU044_2847 family protein [Plantactinospora sp. WMMB782]|uniref:CU044_2847 family protein n=1 Tax=Plantactinospora sp. WMMB782 TaxID=3404121 RepID=UPI003B961782